MNAVVPVRAVNEDDPSSLSLSSLLLSGWMERPDE
jgi:hypothetical protein